MNSALLAEIGKIIVEFETVFFESIQMSSDELFLELMERTDQTKPISWNGLVYRFFEQHPSSVENQIKRDFGEKGDESLVRLNLEIDELESSIIEGSDFSDVDVEKISEMVELLFDQKNEIYESQRTIRENLGKELENIQRFKRAWSKYVHTISLPMCEKSEKYLIIKISKGIASQAKAKGKKITQSRVKEALKDVKPNGFLTPFAWSICYANARLIFGGKK